MLKQVLKYLLVSGIIVILVYTFFGKKENVSTEGGAILFSRYDCPHCKNVEDYIKENNTKEKIQLVEKEIHDSKNAALFMDKAKECGIDEQVLGVPLLYADGKCYSGDVDIIDFFSNLP